MAPSPHGNDSATPSRAVQTSSDHSTASTPLASERLRANPDAQAYLVTGAGQYLLVTLEEVAYYFSLGFDVRDHQTGLPVNVGVVPFSEYASEGSPFARQNMEEAAAREELRAASQDGVGDGGILILPASHITCLCFARRGSKS